MEGSDFLLAGVLFLFAAVAAVPLASRLGIGAVLGYLLAGIASKKSEPSISGLLETADLPASHRRLWRGSPAPVRFAVSPSK